MILNFLAALIWIFLATLQLWRAWDGQSILPALLAIQAVLIGWRLVARRPESGQGAPLVRRVFAWIAVFLPVAMTGQARSLAGEALAFLGILFSIWALWTLGKSFGIAPADRSLVTNGPYRLVRHPMYVGALINTLGFLIGNPSPWNMVVFVILVASIVIRILWEEAALAGYDQYAKMTRWRLLPGVW